jgi:glycine cleavage system H protein
MTVVLVVLTLAILILIDYAQSRKRVILTEPKIISSGSPVSKTQPECLCGFRVPGNFRYHPGHTWALRESPTFVRVGIDELAARMIGRAESILLPKRGQWIRQGQKIFSVFKDGCKIELVSPIEGEVTSVNEAVVNNPSLLDSDPYGDGWLLTVISPDAETNFRNLLDGDLARQWMVEEASRLRTKMPAPTAVAARDDRNETSDLSLPVSDRSRTELTREFFLM